MKKRLKAPKKYTEEEQLQRRKEDSGVIVGGSSGYKKCYLVLFGDVPMCPYNESSSNKNGHCIRFDKVCDNIWE